MEVKAERPAGPDPVLVELDRKLEGEMDIVDCTHSPGSEEEAAYKDLE